MARQIAWLGLGLIGLPMASRLAAAGWQVRGFDVSGERLRHGRSPWNRGRFLHRTCTWTEPL
jgi:UDP-N-acetyl-D-mannosaminuronate dehydrogenase